MKCKKCGKTFYTKHSKWSDGAFCSMKCSRSYSSGFVCDTKKAKPAKCAICGCKVLIKKRADPLKAKCLKCVELYGRYNKRSKKRKSRIPLAKPLTSIITKEAIKMLLQQGLRQKDIARVYGCSSIYLNKLIRKFHYKDGSFYKETAAVKQKSKNQVEILRSGKISNTSEKGNNSVSAILHKLLSKGFSVSLPFGDNQRYDLIADINGYLFKIQCKTGHYTKGCISANCYSVYTWKNGSNKKYYTKEDIDAIMVYYPKLDAVYFISIEDCPKTSIYLRIDSQKTHCRGIKLAKDYEF
jgi:hypothetical protein